MTNYMKKFWKYFLLAVLAWVLMEITTAMSFDFQRWFTYWPGIWLIYLGFPSIFTFLIYKRNFGEWKLFLAMIIEIFIVEIVFTRNALLHTFPIMLIMIPIAICIYAFITYIPLWFVENKLKENKWKIGILVIVWVIVTILAYASKLESI